MALVRLAAVLCIVTVVAVGTAQAVHFHLQASPEQSKHCLLCPSFATAALPAHAVAAAVPVAVHGPVARPIADQSKDRLETCSLFIRPPPSA